MSFVSRRRAFLRTGAAVLAGTALGPWMAARPGIRPAGSIPGNVIPGNVIPGNVIPGNIIDATPLASRLYLLHGAGANVLLHIDDDGALLVDGGRAEHAPALLAAVDSLSGAARVHTLFNTHWHRAHTGANGLLGGDGVRIIAHENTRQWLSTHITWPRTGLHREPLAEPAWPNDTFRSERSLRTGGERIEAGYLMQAHTDGDIYVRFREANVIAVGGVVGAGRYPVPDHVTGGWIGGTRYATERLLEISDADTRIVAAHGPVLDRDTLGRQHRMLEAVMERMVERIVEGMGPDEILADGVTEDFDADWGDPSEFVHNAYWGLWGHVRSLGAGVI